MPKFSIILQSYLGEYKGAASDRERKFLRAVNSILKQTFEDYEIIIVADGCQKTFDLACLHYMSHEKVNCFLIQKQNIWSGQGRNFGIGKATGDYILYLDADDELGADHLKIINEGLRSFDWVYFNDWIYEKDGKNKVERECFIKQKFQSGTSNICHKRSLQNVRWGFKEEYGHDDWGLIQSLLPYMNTAKISTPQYYVCHIPGKLDV